MGLSPYPHEGDWTVWDTIGWSLLGILQVVYSLMEFAAELLLLPLNLLRYCLQYPRAVIEIDQSPENLERSIVLVKKLKRRNPAVQLKKLKKKQGLKCTICLEEVDKNAPVHPLPCNHIFHAGCLHKCVWNNFNTCPLCRAVLVQPKQHGRRRFGMPFL